MKSNKRCPAWIGAAVAYPPGHHGKPGPHKMSRPHGMLHRRVLHSAMPGMAPHAFPPHTPHGGMSPGTKGRVLVSKWRPCTCVDQLDAVSARMHVVGQLCVRIHVVGQLCAHARWDARVWISRAPCTLWIRYFPYFVRKAYKKTKSATIAMRVPASYRRNYDIACVVFATHDCVTIQRWTIRVAMH